MSHLFKSLLKLPCYTTGKFHAAYCPGVSGCRAVIKFEDGIDDHLLDLGDLDLVIHFNNTSGRPVWLVSSSSKLLLLYYNF